MNSVYREDEVQEDENPEENRAENAGKNTVNKNSTDENIEHAEHTIPEEQSPNDGLEVSASAPSDTISPAAAASLSAPSLHHTPLMIQSEIESLGREIFEAIGKKSPALYQKSFWSQVLMRWTMRMPALKADLFRLVDVLPSLKANESITQHFLEYTAPYVAKLPRVMRWAFSPQPQSYRGSIAAFFVKRSVREMAQQFIAGINPAAALKPLRRLRKTGLAYTVDLLGEYTLSEPEALDYLSRYKEAFTVLGQEARSNKRFAKPLIAGHVGEQRPVCVSVKLSALYSQTNQLNFERSVAVLSERLNILVEHAVAANAQLYVDAEDSGTNPIIYAAFERVFGSGPFKDYAYPGLVIQAYAKGAVELTDRMLQFAKARGSPIAIRLVKGAYWDSETITSALNDWPSPLLNKKESSDAQFEYLSRKLLDNHAYCLPAFASHNVRSLCQAVCYADSIGLKKTDYELQMLFGMAEPIARAFADRGYLVRLYVPLGDLFVGMGYLVRRLLENTSNESFLKHTFFDKTGVDALLREPCYQD